MSTLESSLSLKKRSVKGPRTVAPEQGCETGGPTSTGSRNLTSSIAKKNAGIVLSPGVEKVNSAS